MSGCTVSGIDAVEKMLDEITEAEAKKIANEIGDVNVRAMQSSIATDTGRSKESIKKVIKKVNEGIMVTVSPHTPYYGFQEWGTSKDKKNIGKLAKAIDDTKNECVEIARTVIKS